MSPASEATRVESQRRSVIAGNDTTLDGAWAADKWDALRLGVPARRGRGRARFDTISHEWLREPAKTLEPFSVGHRLRLPDHQRRSVGVGAFLPLPHRATP